MKERAEAVAAVVLLAFVAAFYLLPWLTDAPWFRDFVRGLR